MGATWEWHGMCELAFTPSIPLAYAVHIKGIYENLQVLLQTIHYEEHQWSICADLKVTAMLSVLQGG
jgi:hypothetical protein